MWIAAAFVLGEVWAHGSFETGLLGIWLLAAAFWLAVLKKGASKVYFQIFGCLLFLFFCAGIIRRSMEEPNPDLEAYILNTPVLAQGEVYKVLEEGSRLYIRDVRIMEEGILQKTGLCMQVYGKDMAEIREGNKIQVKGRISAFTKPRNPGEFDQYGYYRSLGLDYGMRADSIQVVDSRYSRLHLFLSLIRQKFRESFRSLLNDEDYGVYMAAILGEKSEMDAEIKALYQENGIAHVLAISGLHISLIGLGIYKLMRKGFGFFWGGLASSLFMLLYVVMTGAGVSSQRAFIMFAVSLLGAAAGRTYDMLSAGALALILLSAKSPFLIFNSGFLLSFGAIYGIGFVSNRLLDWLGTKNRVMSSFSASLAVFLVTLPVTAWYFFEAAPYSVLLNLLVIPCMTLVMVSGFAGGVFGMINPLPGRLLIGLGHYILLFYQWLLKAARLLPGARWLTGRPAEGQILLYYGLLGMFLLAAPALKKRMQRKGLPFLILFLVTALLSVVISWKGQGLLKITFLDVSQGDGIVLELPKGAVFLIDGGSSDIKKLGQYRLIPFLKSQKTGHLDYAVVTHGDEDHISGLKEILKGQDISIGVLVLPKTNLQDEKYLELVRLAQEAGTEVLYLEKGDSFREGEAVITCLHPAAEFTARERNEYSTVLRVDYRDFSLLLTGDLEANGEELLTDFGLEPVDMLKAAHHGSKYSTGELFLAQTTPRFTVISCGEGNSYGHPHRELMERLQGSGSQVYLTRDMGAVIVTTNGYRTQIRGYLEPGGVTVY